MESFNLLSNEEILRGRLIFELIKNVTTSRPSRLYHYLATPM